ncbi:Protachykinin-1 isoform X2 [Aix galericulata]|nr:Protachykinin-1 isoform X2 [Aix galericulata]
MRLPLAFAVLLLASARALADEMGAPDDLSYWADWADGEQAKEELPLPLEHFLQRMARRPRPQQFFGLMGKRDAGYGQISHKSSSERSIAQNYERRQQRRSKVVIETQMAPEWLQHFFRTDTQKSIIGQHLKQWSDSIDFSIVTQPQIGELLHPDRLHAIQLINNREAMETKTTVEHKQNNLFLGIGYDPLK